MLAGFGASSGKAVRRFTARSDVAARPALDAWARASRASAASGASGAGVCKPKSLGVIESVPRLRARWTVQHRGDWSHETWNPISGVGFCSIRSRRSFSSSTHTSVADSHGTLSASRSKQKGQGSARSPRQAVVRTAQPFGNFLKTPGIFAVSVRKSGGKAVVATRRATKKVAKLTLAFIRDPKVAIEWKNDMKEALVHMIKWVSTGLRLFRKNLGAAFYLTKKAAKGYRLSLKERNLLVKTTADCLKIIPFSFFIIVPAAEVLLPFALRLFPNMLPSTFNETKYDSSTLARKYKAKKGMAEFWQQVVSERAEAIMKDDAHQHHNRASELQQFQEKLLEGKAFPSIKKLLRFSNLFKEELTIDTMTPTQLKAMSQMLGLRTYTLTMHMQLQLRHHITSLRREDREMLWEGLEHLHGHELVEACQKRAIRCHDASDEDMRRDLARWLECSANRKIPTSLLLWIQSFYLSGCEAAEGMKVHEAKPAEFAASSLSSIKDPEDMKAAEVFKDVAERRKAKAESIKERLTHVEHEIEQVIEEEKRRSSVTEDAAVEVGGVSKEVEKDPKPKADVSDILFDTMDKDHDGVITRSDFREAIQERQALDRLEEHHAVRARIEELSKALELHRDIVERQQLLLSHQLEFMAHMRGNIPTQQRDAGRILLDQRVRLVEMMHSFSEDTAAIEALLSEAEAGAHGPDAFMIDMPTPSQSERASAKM